MTDTAGCVSQENVTLTEPDQVMFDLVYDTVVCEDAQVTVMATLGFDEYIWSDGQTGNPVVVMPGEYCVTVVDSDGCFGDTCFIIGVSPPLSIEIDTVIDTDAGENNGEIQITVEGGTAPVTFMWSDSEGNVVSSVEDPTGLAPGDYFVIVIDAFGCESTSDTVTVGVISSVKNIADEIDLQLMPNPARDLVNIRIGSRVLVDQVKIFSSSGKELITRKANGVSIESIDVDVLPAGFYYMTLNTPGGIAVSKFIKL